MKTKILILIALVCFPAEFLRAQTQPQPTQETDTPPLAAADEKMQAFLRGKTSAIGDLEEFIKIRPDYSASAIRQLANNNRVALDLIRLVNPIAGAITISHFEGRVSVFTAFAEWLEKKAGLSVTAPIETAPAVTLGSPTPSNTALPPN